MYDLFLQYDRIVRRVVRYEHRVDGSLTQYKAAVDLADGTRLHINEVWIEARLEKYAYYRLTAGGTLICGWDNAPHHPHVDTYPHHVHEQGMATSSYVRSLADVLRLIAQELSE